MSSGSSLESIAGEIRGQPSLLHSFRSGGLPEPEERPMLVGAGDSYAASLCAYFLAGPRVTALDPFSLAASLGWAKGRTVCIVSISGRTRSNIELARALKRTASRTVAITCNPGSDLARSVDAVVDLGYRPAAKSPGISTFTLSLAAVLSVCGMGLDLDFRRAFSNGSEMSRDVRIAGRSGLTHFAGNNADYAACVYGVAKVYELLGGRAQASLLEEFSHMPLFSLSSSDTVNVVSATEGRRGERLAVSLRREGYASSLIRPRGGPTERLYSLIFALQIAAAKEAKRRGLKAPHFLRARSQLRISDEMIY